MTDLVSKVDSQIYPKYNLELNLNSEPRFFHLYNGDISSWKKLMSLNIKSLDGGGRSMDFFSSAFPFWYWLSTCLPQPYSMSVFFQKARISIKIIYVVPVPQPEYPQPAL